MLFGELSKAALKNMKFKLPADPAVNKTILKGSKSGSLKIYLGCAKWGRPEWIGKIYPKGAKEKDFLKYYGQHYGSIELNATNYKIYPPSTLAEWAMKVDNANFKFCPKAHRGMSFLKDSPTKPGVTKDFLRNIRAFGNNLGVIFITHDEKVKWDEQ